MTPHDIEIITSLRGTQPCDIKLEKKLDSGGVSDIWIASHPEIPFEFLVKYSKNCIQNNYYLLGQFEREYEASQFLCDHSAIDCTVYIADFGVDVLDHPYLLVEYFPSRPLDNVIPQIHEWSTAKDILRKAAQLLTKIHSIGIVHRDIKPSNFLINSNGEMRIIDFALSTLEGNWHPYHNEGIAIGTPLYMSPEQAYGRKIMLTSACDWYSFGIMMYEWISGKVPFHGKTSTDTIRMHCFDEVPLPVNKNIHDAPESLPYIILALLCKEPNARFSAVKRLEELLESV